MKKSEQVTDKVQFVLDELIADPYEVPDANEFIHELEKQGLVILEKKGDLAHG